MTSQKKQEWVCVNCGHDARATGVLISNPPRCPECNAVWSAPVGGEGEGWEEELRLKVQFDRNQDREVCILFIRRLLAKAREEGVREGRALEGKEWSDAVKRNLRP